MAITLFDDQQRALDAVLAVFGKQPQGGKALVVAPTGWGKTIFFSTLARVLKGINILVVAHRDELLNQARDKMLLVDPSLVVGKVGGGVYEWGAQVTVAGVDTISQPRHLKNLHKFGYGLVIWDEAHHCRAPKYEKVRHALPNAFHLGVTATPARLDGKSLEPLFGAPVFHMDIKEAIQLGRLCNVRGQAIKTDVDLDDIKTAKNVDGDIDFNEQELEKAIDIASRNSLIVEKYREYADGKQAVAFCVTVKHAENLATTFDHAGIPSACLTGDTTLQERARIFEAYRAGKIKVLTNVLVLSEGWDEPCAEVAIMARPTQSNSLYIQCIGRILRLYEGKQALILDITDNSLRLRLSPVNLRRATGVEAKDGELLTEAIIREEKEQPIKEEAEKQAVVRKLNESRRQDIALDLFALPAWEERPSGIYVMEVGPQKHRIALVPKGSGLYEVQARLAPGFQGQKWFGAQPLEVAREMADKRANLLLADESAVKLVDKNASWRDRPVDPEGKQVKMLKWYHIPWTPEMTKGEASDLIETRKRILDARKAKKVAKKEEQVSA